MKLEGNESDEKHHNRHIDQKGTVDSRIVWS